MLLACSADTAAEIDRKLQVVKEQYEKAEKLLKSHMKELNSLAQYLYAHETITGEEFMDILKETSSDGEKPEETV